MRRESANLDLSWIRDKSLEDSADLEDPDLIAEEIADDLQAALEQFATIAADLRERERQDYTEGRRNATLE
jgi:type I restriction enzyme M protein